MGRFIQYPENENGIVMWLVIWWHHNMLIWPNTFWRLHDGAKFETMKLNDLAHHIDDVLPVKISWW